MAVPPFSFLYSLQDHRFTRGIRPANETEGFCRIDLGAESVAFAKFIKPPAKVAGSKVADRRKRFDFLAVERRNEFHDGLLPPGYNQVSA